ncbi:MAG: anion permease [Holosporales bacterium]|jgi:DASS family divalent anion:Na+ symporter|nr:anion permease [Holosporales bacterium]
MVRNLMRRILVLSVLCIVGFCIAILPTPSGVNPKAYPIFGIFIVIVLGFLAKPYPMSVLSLLGMFVAIASGLFTINEGFSCFNEPVIWLIVFASIAAQAFIKTNLGHRVACFFIKKMGHSSIGLAYGLVVNEMFFASIIPANTARAVCITVPLAVSMSTSLGSSPQNGTEKRLGSYLNFCGMQANNFSSALFLTAVGSNPIVQKMMFEMGIQVTWLEWFIISCVPCIACLLIIPLIMYKLVPPELKKIPEASDIAQKQLDEMPKITKQEIMTMLIFAGMLFFWIIGSFFSIHTALVALGGLCALLIIGVLDIDDVTGAKDVWNIAIWLAILNFFAGRLTQYGLIQHYSEILNSLLAGYSWGGALLIVAIIYYFARYFIPGNVMHACAMFPAFSQLIISCGVPAKLGCMLLALITAFCGYVAPYGSTAGPIVLNTGYIEQRSWWKIGFTSGALYLFIWFILGGIWWKVLGYW